MREINKIAEALFEKIRDRFEDVSLGDENAKATQKPEDARFFNFDYTINGKSHGNITISVIDENSLKVYFSKNISSELDDEEKTEWYSFLRELREFARRNLLSFEPRDITRSTLKHRDIQQQSKADATYSKDEVIGESRLHGTSRSSYEQDGNVKIIVRHSDRVDPEQRGARSRKIRAIFVETADGERFKLPYNNLRYARAMACHVSEGGNVSDDFGQHITKIAEECSKLKPFKSAMVRRVFEDEETRNMVEATFEYHALLNDTLKKMSGRKGYAACKESFQTNEETLMDDFDADSMRERFVRKTYNDATDSALPIVQKAYKMKKENKFAQQFESWANNVAEGTWATPDDEETLDELIDLLSEPLQLGVDAQNATNALYNIIGDDTLFDWLEDAAKDDPEADARDTIMQWVYDNMPETYSKVMSAIGDEEPADQYEPEIAEGADNTPIADAIRAAIIRRIINSHLDLLAKHGPEAITQAAEDVAWDAGDVDEIGSSDVSAWVNQVKYQLEGSGEVDEAFTPREETPLTYKKEAPSKKRQNAKYYDYLARTLSEGKMKDIALDIDELSNKQFYAKYKKSKADMQAALAEGQGDDVVNKDEKLKRMGAKPLGMLDKLKTIPQGIKAMAKGEPEDDLVLYNKSKSNLEEMKRLAGLK